VEQTQDLADRAAGQPARQTATIQIPIAGFKTPTGVDIEGRGVQPDRRVLETRAALLAGHDPVLDEALQIARSTK
jgi:C-terminal processing protease CtpA/Prc